MNEQDRRSMPIAVVGVAALFPGSSDSGGFWRDILAGRDLIGDVPPAHWLVEDYYDPDPAARDKTYARRGAFLDPVHFDPLEWGVPPSTVPATDTSQLLALVVAQRVLEDACGGQFERIDRSRTSVILGVTSAQELLGSMVSRLQRPVWTKALRESGLPESQVQAACDRIASHYVEWQESTFPGILGNVVAGRIANRLDLGGTNCVTDAACASAFAAVSMAVNELRLGDSDLVLTGGVDTMNDIFMYMCFSKTPALSPTGDCRPFSSGADGTMLGEGIGMVALRRLEDAERDGDRIYAVIAGVGSSSDGRAKSVYAPLASGQARAIRRAHAQAGFGPATVDLVEAHGTGTKAGDVAEFEGLRSVYDESGRVDRQWCALGSVKSQVGHTKAAAGAAGLFKAVMSLHAGVLPPTIKVDEPNAALDLPRSPFYLPSTARPWIRGSEHPRRAAVSSFGFGGSNFHVLLEEYRGTAPRHGRLRAAASELVLLGETTPRALRARCEEIAALSSRATLAWIARTTQESFDPRAEWRLAVVARSADELCERLALAQAPIDAGAPVSTPFGVELGRGARLEGGLAFLFPGQGSQYAGMGADVAVLHGIARSPWDEAADVLSDLDEPLHRVAWPISAASEDERQRAIERLTATEWAQPALAAASMGWLRVLDALGLRPDAVAGHSFGELVALHAAGSLSAADLLRAARRRGELMAESGAIPGAMAAIAASRELVEERLRSWGTGVAVANHNAPKQVVVSGPLEEIARVEERFAAEGVRTSRLPVSTAFHSELMRSASDGFARFLEGIDILPPSLPVIANVTASEHPREAEGMRALLASQVVEPVPFVDVVELLFEGGVRTFVEVGPDAVLSQLVGRILEGRPHAAIPLDRKGQEGSYGLHLALGRLAVAGQALDFARLWEPFARSGAPKEASPRHAIAISGANHGKPYPPAEGASARPAPNPEPATAPGIVSIDQYSASAAPVASPAPPASPAWLEAHAALQRETAEAHAAYQRAMSETHVAFLRTAESALAGLAAMAGGASGASVDTPARSPAPPLPRAIAPAPAPSPVPVIEPPPPPPPPAPPAEVSRPDVAAVLLQIVADKTGYPPDMLGADLDLDLEADLGVDSIKRVEIFAALADRLPSLPPVEPKRMASLRTLALIAAFLRGEEDRPAAAAAAAGPSSPSPDTIVPAPAPAPARVPEAAPELGREEVVVVEAPRAGLALPGLDAPDGVVVTDDGGGIARELVRVLAARGVRARVVADVPQTASAVIVLAGLRDLDVDVDSGPGPGMDAERALAMSREAFRAARAASRRLSTAPGAFVTVQDTGGDFGLSGSPRAAFAGLAGLAKTVDLEWPLASVRALDIERGERSVVEIATAIADELFEGGAEIEVGLRVDGRRVSLTTRAASLPSGACVISEADLVVVSGGARGVTAASAIALARASRCRMLLLGRTRIEDEPACTVTATTEAEIKSALHSDASLRGEALAPAELGALASRILAAREVRRTLAEIEAAGAAARYESVDVRDELAVAEAIERARADWGEVRALVHGAGSIADRLVAEKTDAQFDATFGTKVLGMGALLRATAHDPLKALIVFGSVAGREGNAGQADYAMANEVVACMASCERRRRGDDVLVRAIAWGPWDGGMVTPSLAARFRERGIGLVPVAAGARRFVDELRDGDPGVVEVVAGVAGASGGLGGTREVRVEAEASRRALPELDGHRVKGVAVVPAVLALEWMVRAGSGLHPGRALLRCRELKVLRGIRLGDEDASERFIVRAVAGGREGDALVVKAEVLSRGGARHYSVMLDFASREDQVILPQSGLASMTAAQALPSFAGPTYGGALFHEGPFQVIRSVAGLGDEAGEALLVGSRGTALEPSSRRLDIGLLDGALQLAVLWTERRLGHVSLPTSIAAIVPSSEGAHEGVATARLRAGSAGGSRAVSDVILEIGGRTIVSLHGVETHALASPTD